MKIQKKVRLASIGIGMIGLLHAQILASLNDCEYISISDPDPSKEEKAKSLGVRFYTDYKEMIAKEELDGVIISVPNEMHREVGSYCAGQGLHIFIEKPIASTTEDAERLISSTEKNKVSLLIGHHRRFNPAVNRMKEILDRNELGNLLGISMLWSMYKPAEYFQAKGSWRRHDGGGPILINLIHEIDILRYLTGDEIVNVYAEVNNSSRKFEVEDTVSVILRFRKGFIANVMMTDSSPSPWGYEALMEENDFFHHTNGNIYYFFGDKASMDFPQMRKNYYRNPSETGWQYPMNYDDLGVKSGNPYPDQMKHFCTIIRGNESPRTSGKDALTSLKAAIAVKQSAAAKQPVQLIN